MLGKIVPESVRYHKDMNFSDPNVNNLVAEVSCEKKVVLAPRGKSEMHGRAV